MDEDIRPSAPTGPGDPAKSLADDASAALLALLEGLPPEARAAFLMREGFETGYAEIVQALGRSEAECREAVVRAKARLRALHPSASLPDLSTAPPGASMSQRLHYIQQSPELFKKFIEFSALIDKGAIDATTHDLVVTRASQLNGCGFCVDMHVKQARMHGERELRLYHLAVWRESTLFTPRERAALAWTEVLTNLPPHGVPDELYERVRGQLSEKELSDLTFLVMGINAWNRVNVAFRTVPGSSDKAFGLDKANLS